MANAAIGQSVKFEQAWLIEAILGLKPYVKSFTAKFMRRHNLPVLKSKTAMLTRIQNEINNPEKPLRFEDLVKYLDELRLWGKQCVFLYALRYDEKEYLEKLLDPDYIKKRLGKLKGRFNNNICRWKSNKPFLSEVRHDFDYEKKSGRLSFKWIQTREFEKLIGRSYRTFEERSVNFFIIDLADGSAQLRIQTLPSMPLKKLDQELQTYTEEIEKLLDFQLFSLVSLQPVMRESLFKKVLPIARWSVKTKKGELSASKVSPTFVQRRLTLPLGGVTPHEVNLYWKCQQEVGNINRGRLHFALEAEDNVIVFNAMTDAPRVNYLVSNILEVGRLHSKDKEIKEVIDIAEIIDPPPPPGIWRGGLRDWIKRKAAGKPGEKLKKAVAEAAILPGLAIIRVLFGITIPWLAEELIEKISSVPFIVFELLVYGVLLFIFYGGDRVRKFFFKIPPKYATVAIKLFLGESAELVINSREYDNWRKAQAT